ncbi:CdaR family transcriptional regulator [Streptomyces sp. NBC_00154]|uniref:PucR family transcriptional regulator n=1 Tax=Streptomyces sp. NBC_00154 TaxID=2975670 RepID=UPI0022511AAB|nr:helix-turn-helix domain-containing protein [Streptomyces sp. NBC_00154]MCX5316022.1 helix-turn-helix domain-containing protein [Streptomyces sp. NBC_00154]
MIPEDIRRAYHHRVLGPVLDYDAAHGSDLVNTLETFLAASGSWQACAEVLHVHINTVRYRIQRVQDLTGLDLASLPDRLHLYLALKSR